MDRTKRIERVKEELVEKEKDALIVSGGSDVQYFSGFEVYADGGTRGWYPLVVIPREGEPLLLVGGLDRGDAENNATIDYRVPEDSFSDEVKDLLEEGSEELVSDGVSAGFYSKLSDDLSLAFSELVQNMRAVKEQEEVNEIEEAYKLTERIFNRLLPELRIDRTESEIAGAVEYSIRSEGGIASFPSVVASGSRSSYPHHSPRAVKVGEGPLLFDIGARLHGYVSDFSRTVFLGEPDESEREVYEAVREAQSNAEEILRAGITASEVDERVREVLSDAGHEDEFPHASGHGIGLSIHEAPKLSFKSDEELEAGMVVTIEPGIYIEGEFGIRIEDAYVVEEDGAERLSSRSRELQDHIIDV